MPGHYLVEFFWCSLDSDFTQTKKIWLGYLDQKIASKTSGLSENYLNVYYVRFCLVLVSNETPVTSERWFFLLVRDVERQQLASKLSHSSSSLLQVHTSLISFPVSRCSFFFLSLKRISLISKLGNIGCLKKLFMIHSEFPHSRPNFVWSPDCHINSILMKFHIYLWDDVKIGLGLIMALMSWTLRIFSFWLASSSEMATCTALTAIELACQMDKIKVLLFWEGKTRANTLSKG